MARWLKAEGGSPSLQRIHDWFEYNGWSREDVENVINVLVDDGKVKLEISGKAAISIVLVEQSS